MIVQTNVNRNTPEITHAAPNSAFCNFFTYLDGETPMQCNCFIEVSRESRMKYEWDEETNMLKLDRVLHGAAFYPHDYGFIPQTLCGDGDPLVRIKRHTEVPLALPPAVLVLGIRVACFFVFSRGSCRYWFMCTSCFEYIGEWTMR